MKASLTDLFINGADLQFSKIDFTSKKVKKEISNIKIEQEETIRKTIIDIEKLKKSYLK